jgi:hypothetical protein
MGRKGDFRGLGVVKGVFERVPSDITWDIRDKSGGATWDTEFGLQGLEGLWGF